jgi:hypothetical protein
MTLLLSLSLGNRLTSSLVEFVRSGFIFGQLPFYFAELPVLSLGVQSISIVPRLNGSLAS